MTYTILWFLIGFASLLGSFAMDAKHLTIRDILWAIFFSFFGLINLCIFIVFAYSYINWDFLDYKIWEKKNDR